MGEFYFYGFDRDNILIEKVRTADSKHSGDSPKHLLTEGDSYYEQNVNRFDKGETKMGEITNEVNKIIPSSSGFKNFAVLGMEVYLGLATANLVGGYVGSKFKSPVPVISSRTLGSAGSMLVLYTAHRMVKQETLKDVLKYATAGATASVVGSLVFDVLSATNVKVPSLLNFMLSTATGVSSVVSSGSESGSNVDVNTEFA